MDVGRPSFHPIHLLYTIVYNKCAVCSGGGFGIYNFIQLLDGSHKPKFATQPDGSQILALIKGLKAMLFKIYSHLWRGIIYTRLQA